MLLARNSFFPHPAWIQWPKERERGRRADVCVWKRTVADRMPCKLMVLVNDGNRVRVYCLLTRPPARQPSRILKTCQRAKPPKGIIKMWTQNAYRHNTHTREWESAWAFSKRCLSLVASASIAKHPTSECQQFHWSTSSLQLNGTRRVKWKWRKVCVCVHTMWLSTPLAGSECFCEKYHYK